MNKKLWYAHPDEAWMNGLPVGSGRLAAMVRNAEKKDVLSLNHEWLWRGKNRQRENITCANHLAEIRRLLQQEDFFRATALANAWLGGLGGISGLPGRVDAYQPAADLTLELPGTVGFERRELDISEGLVTACRRVLSSEGSEAILTSQFIAHAQDQRIYLHCHCPAAFEGFIVLSRTEDAELRSVQHLTSRRLSFSGSFPEGMTYVVQVDLDLDGQTEVCDEGIAFHDTRELLLSVQVTTSVMPDLSAASRQQFSYTCRDWPERLAIHRRFFSSAMNRMDIELDQEDNPLPTDERIAALRAGASDETLLILAAHYGRYLLVASSMGSDLPANLQGKWNDAIKPPWECDYHFDINLQMNYWAAEATGLSECSEALFRYVLRMSEHGRKAARDLYGCRGVWLPIQTDAWGRATPESYGWSVWIGAAPWIAQHFWWHYLYHGDLDFLAGKAYPFLRDVALFYEDYCTYDEAGVVQIMPSQSPENRFAGTGHFPVSIGISSAMDVQLAYDALGYAIKAAGILGTDEEAVLRWQQLRDHLPPFAIGQDGRLLEWEKDRVEVEPGHRHLSHLYGLYPSDLFNPEERPDEYDAALLALDSRLEQGGGHTGWSRAWVACLSARAGRGEAVREHLRGLVVDFATESLLDLHPPRIFQIDGNLGAAACLNEALAQYWNGCLHLLRALPAAWPSGRVSGMHVPGGHRISFRWQDGQLVDLHVKLGYAGALTIAGPGLAQRKVLTGRPDELFDLHVARTDN